MKKSSIFSKQSIRDILITASEGGIGYWSQLTRLSYNRITATLREWNEDNRTWTGDEHSITYDDIVRGFKLAIEKGIQFEDTTCLDSTEADIVIQYAIFGDVIYG